jgi:hypothetical protein
VDTRNVPKDLKVVDWKPKRDGDWSFLRLSAAALGWLVGERAAGEIGRLVGSDGALGGLRLDGLVSVWQGAER